jgi:hypothetical protein
LLSFVNAASSLGARQCWSSQLGNAWWPVSR